MVIQDDGAGDDITMRRGKLFVVSAPSGAGKTSLVNALVESEPALSLAISYTTRAKRATEIEGVHYFFVNHLQFDQLRREGELLEHAQVFDNYYGTSRSQVELSTAHGRDVILEIDWQGAQQVRSAMPEAETVFILPPSLAELERRLRARGTDSAKVVRRRLRDSVSDIRHWQEFDYVVFNDDFDVALQRVRDVVNGDGSASHSTRQGLHQEVETLLA